MRLILLTSAMAFCAMGGALVAWLTSESRRRLHRSARRSRLAELIAAQTEEDLRRHQPPQFNAAVAGGGDQALAGK